MIKDNRVGRVIMMATFVCWSERCTAMRCPRHARGISWNYRWKLIISLSKCRRKFTMRNRINKAALQGSRLRLCILGVMQNPGVVSMSVSMPAGWRHRVIETYDSRFHRCRPHVGARKSIFWQTLSEMNIFAISHIKAASIRLLVKYRPAAQTIKRD